MTKCELCRETLAPGAYFHGFPSCALYLKTINKMLLEALKKLYQMTQNYRPRSKPLSAEEHVTPIEQQSQEDYEVDCLYYRVERAIAAAEGK